MAAPSTAAFTCGGKLESEVWDQWDKKGYAFVKDQLIAKRLITERDTYALYDVEIRFHNLLAMAQRCQRIERQMQIARFVSAAYPQLQPAPDGQLGRAWICRGGAVCNSTNRLINTEVKLNSMQFLAFAASVASGINRVDAPASSSGLVAQTAGVSLEHLGRWSSLRDRMALRKRIAAKPEDVKDGSSALFLTDRDLWQVAIYVDLAGILAKRPQLATPSQLDVATRAAMKEHLTLLLRLFAARTTKQAVRGPDGKPLMVADLDVGFWRLYADNRFAGYRGSGKPVVCTRHPGKPDTWVTEARIDASGVPPISNIGWDISHARRLVHFFDAIERNRDALIQMFDVAPSDLPSQEIMTAFARQLRLRVWNQDAAQPLFANYFSGVNGWYRVGYNNGTGQCREGYPPSGLTDSFPQGGYVTWATFDPGLQRLAERLYALTKSDSEADQAFIKAHYPNLAKDAPANGRMLAEMMFWPTLIGN